MPKAVVNGFNMYYEVHGKGDSLVLIHGFGQAHQRWLFQVPAFKKHFMVVTFDSRGIGKTDRSKNPYTIKTLADDVVDLMDCLGIDKAHILGLSLGGMVAQEIAINYPHRVRKLVLGSTFAIRKATDASPEIQRVFGVKEGSPVADVHNIDFHKLMNDMIYSAFNKPLYRAIFKLLLRMRRRSMDTGGYLEQIRAVMGYSTIDRLHLIQAPTLVITGTADRHVLPHNSDLIAEHISNAKLVKVDGGSHSFFIEMRGEFNKEVLAFLHDD